MGGAMGWRPKRVGESILYFIVYITGPCVWRVGGVVVVVVGVVC